VYVKSLTEKVYLSLQVATRPELGLHVIEKDHQAAEVSRPRLYLLHKIPEKLQRAVFRARTSAADGLVRYQVSCARHDPVIHAAGYSGSLQAGKAPIRERRSSKLRKK